MHPATSEVTSLSMPLASREVSTSSLGNSSASADAATDSIPSTTNFIRSIEAPDNPQSPALSSSEFLPAMPSINRNKENDEELDERRRLVSTKTSDNKKKYIPAVEIAEVGSGIIFTTLHLTFLAGWSFFNGVGFHPFAQPSARIFAKNDICGGPFINSTQDPTARCHRAFSAEASGNSMLVEYNTGLALIDHINALATSSSAPASTYFFLFPSLLGVIYIASGALKSYLNGELQKTLSTKDWKAAFMKWAKSNHVKLLVVTANFIFPWPFYAAGLSAQHQISTYTHRTNGVNNLFAPLENQREFLSLTNTTLQNCHTPKTDNGEIPPEFASCLMKYFWYYGAQAKRAINFQLEGFKDSITKSLITIGSLSLAGAVGYMLYNCYTGKRKGTETIEYTEETSHTTTQYGTGTAHLSLVQPTAEEFKDTDKVLLEKEKDELSNQLEAARRELKETKEAKDKLAANNEALMARHHNLEEMMQKKKESLKKKEAKTGADSGLLGFSTARRKDPFVAGIVTLKQAEVEAEAISKINDSKTQEYAADLKKKLILVRENITAAKKSQEPSSVDQTTIGSRGMFISKNWLPEGQGGIPAPRTSLLAQSSSSNTTSASAPAVS